MNLLKKIKIVLCVLFISIGVLKPCTAEILNVKLLLIKQSPLFWPFFLGIEKGYFKEENLGITSVEINNLNQISDALRKNDINFAVLPSIFVLSENKKDFYLTALSSVSNGSDAAIWSSRYKNLEDLRGKRIVLDKNNMTDLLFLLDSLEMRKITPKDIELIDNSDSIARLMAVTAGVADATVLPRRLYFEAKGKKLNNLYELKDAFNTFPSYVLVGNKNWITQQHEDFIMKFLMGQIKSQWFLNYNVSESVKVLETIIGQDRKLINDIIEYKAVNKLTPDTAMIDIDSLADRINFLSKYETSIKELTEYIYKTVNISYLSKAKLKLCQKCWRLPSCPPK